MIVFTRVFCMLDQCVCIYICYNNNCPCVIYYRTRRSNKANNANSLSYFTRLYYYIELLVLNIYYHQQFKQFDISLSIFMYSSLHLYIQLVNFPIIVKLLNFP